MPERHDEKQSQGTNDCEIADEVGMSRRSRICPGCHTKPGEPFEPVYTDGGDTLYVMDQISDKKNKEETWVEQISLSEAMNRLPENGNATSLNFVSTKAKHRWKLPRKSAFPRHRSAVWKRTHCEPCAIISGHNKQYNMSK